MNVKRMILLDLSLLTGNGRGFCAGADLANGGWPTENGWSAGKQQQMLWRLVLIP